MEFQAGKQSWSAGEAAGDNCLMAFLARSPRNPIQRGESRSHPSAQSSRGFAGLDLLVLGDFRGFGVWEMRAPVPILVLLQGGF